MGRDGGPCHVCGDLISPSDLDARRAVTLLKKHYCRDCSDQIATKGLRGTQESRGFRRKLQVGTMTLAAMRGRFGAFAAAIASVAVMVLLYALGRSWGISP